MKLIFPFLFVFLLLITVSGILLLSGSHAEYMETCDLERGIDRPIHCQDGFFDLLCAVSDALTEEKIP